MKIHAPFLFVIVAALVAFALHPAFAAEKTSGGEGDKKSGMFSSGPQNFYVRLNPMILPVVGDKGVQEIVSVLVALEVSDQHNIEIVNGVLPRLNDAYMRALYGTIDKTAYRNGRFIDVTKIKSCLATVTDNVVGKGIVHDVLIQGVNQRQFN